MSRLPVASGSEIVRAFERAGWTVARQRGSHVILVREGRPANLSVPLHREVDPGTLRGLIRDAGLTATAFVSLLRG
ncbi:MAG: type II toxin-antitoxin system HicA family toxin [Armatimonadetes bacterium]|nr:type II toxin-antitoxin system HicA family toxin [Armatimonadota bacterium]